MIALAFLITITEDPHSKGTRVKLGVTPWERSFASRTKKVWERGNGGVGVGGGVEREVGNMSNSNGGIIMEHTLHFRKILQLS